MEKLEQLSFADLRALKKIVKKEIKKKEQGYNDAVHCNKNKTLQHQLGSINLDPLERHLNKLRLLQEAIEEDIHTKLYELIY